MLYSGNMKFYVEVFISSKSNKKTYALVGETPLKKYYLTFDTSVILDALDMTPSVFANMGVGKYNIESEGRFDNYNYS